MNSIVMKKTSGLLAVVMIISLLLPVFAFAATGFSSTTYYGGNVSGSVYSEVYNPNGVAVSVYAPNGSLITTTSATYSNGVDNNGVYNYQQFNTTVVGSTYAYVNLFTSVSGSVYQKVYNTDPTSISLDSTAYTLTLGGTTTHNTVVTATYYDASTAIVSNSATYNGYDPAIVSVSASGVVTALSAGNTVITATYGNQTAQAAVTVTLSGGGVTPVTLSSISLDSTAYTLTLGGTTTHNTVVTATYSDTSTAIVSNSATYYVSNPAIASVSTSGVVTALSVGDVIITALYDNQVAQASVTVTSSSSSSSSGGGGGGASSTTNPTTVEVGADGKVDAAGLTNAFKASNNPQLAIKEFASIPASALIEAATKAGASLTIVSENGTYVLPLSILKLDDLAKSLGIAVADLNIKASITKVSGDTATKVAAAASALGAISLTDAIDFKVTAEGKNGKSIEINSFGNTYVSRSVTISKTLDMKKVTGVLYNEVTKKLSFVPATFAMKDGKTVVTLKRNGNSIYTVVEINKNFTDIASHWSKDDVSLLANKLVIDGATDTTFAPDRNITRAEFAALVVRSLGLNTNATSTTFTDVKSSDWYAGAVAAAAGAKIINGYEDGSFKADAQITREELAAMVVRAMTFAGVKSDLSATQQAAMLGKFTDAVHIVWAQKEVAAAINAGVINGLTNTTIGSGKQATRAEAATMLKRFLTKAGFIN